MTTANGKSTVSMVILVWTVIAVTMGCSTVTSKQQSASSGNRSVSGASDNAPVYHDFGDVMLPRDLKVDLKNSFIFHTQEFRAGVLVLTGGVDSGSLYTFFENGMPTDGWQQLSGIKAPRSMMLFKKESRWCVISIDDGRFSTQVEIWVAPTSALVSGMGYGR
jgi:uncharacterized protein YceK